MVYPFVIRPLLVALPGAGLVVGLALHWLGYAGWPDRIWAAATLPVLLALLIEIAQGLRRGDVGLDVVAALSMTAALVFGEELAAVVVALMYAGGQYLESFAERRARREMTMLLERAPRTALRYSDGQLDEVALETVVPGDRLLVRRGDIVPVDGTLVRGVAVLDQSALTGESIPVQQREGEAILSGVTNAGEPFDLLAARRAGESTYAAIVRLVETAQRSKAPMSRLADRYAMAFLALTVAIAGGAWLWTGDAIRMVAVLVVATPCPLILAVPVAIVSGLSRAARHGILVKGGKALETMARVRALVIDKTGTLTHGQAEVRAVRADPVWSADDVLRLAASLDQASQHIVAQAIVGHARSREMRLTIPSDVRETPGEGVEGRVEGHAVIVGGTTFVARKTDSGRADWQHVRAPGEITVSVAIDGALAGEIVLSDPVRAGTTQLLASLRDLGLERIVLATGDHAEIAQSVASGLPIDAIRAELTPDQKVMVVLSERKFGPVMMVGDGVNDAPALAAADVGVAMGVKGAAASAEAADVVLMVDQLGRVASAIAIAQRSRRIALESVYAGLGASILGMAVAAMGGITPVQGAVLQELIDVAVILNALRALFGGTATPEERRP